MDGLDDGLEGRMFDTIGEGFALHFTEFSAGERGIEIPEPEAQTKLQM